MKYRDQPEAAARLQAKLKTGGSGVWGEVPMPLQPATSDAEEETLVRALLDLAQGMAETRGTATGQLTLPAAPDTPQPGSAWEITAESPATPQPSSALPRNERNRFLNDLVGNRHQQGSTFRPHSPL